jgi:hypothetical protein
MSETSMAAPGGGAAGQWRLDDRVALATARRAGLLDQLARECGERIDVMPGHITDARPTGRR